MLSTPLLSLALCERSNRYPTSLPCVTKVPRMRMKPTPGSKLQSKQRTVPMDNDTSGSKELDDHLSEKPRKLKEAGILFPGASHTCTIPMDGATVIPKRPYFEQEYLTLLQPHQYKQANHSCLEQWIRSPAGKGLNEPVENGQVTRNCHQDNRRTGILPSALLDNRTREKVETQSCLQDGNFNIPVQWGRGRKEQLLAIRNSGNINKGGAGVDFIDVSAMTEDTQGKVTKGDPMAQGLGARWSVGWEVSSVNSPVPSSHMVNHVQEESMGTDVRHGAPDMFSKDLYITPRRKGASQSHKHLCPSGRCLPSLEVVSGIVKELTLRGRCQQALPQRAIHPPSPSDDDYEDNQNGEGTCMRSAESLSPYPRLRERVLLPWEAVPFQKLPQPSSSFGTIQVPSITLSWDELTSAQESIILQTLDWSGHRAQQGNNPSVATDHLPPQAHTELPLLTATDCDPFYLASVKTFLSAAPAPAISLGSYIVEHSLKLLSTQQQSTIHQLHIEALLPPNITQCLSAKNPSQLARISILMHWLRVSYWRRLFPFPVDLVPRGISHLFHFQLPPLSQKPIWHNIERNHPLPPDLSEELNEFYDSILSCVYFHLLDSSAAIEIPATCIPQTLKTPHGRRWILLGTGISSGDEDYCSDPDEGKPELVVGDVIMQRINAALEREDRKRLLMAILMSAGEEVRDRVVWSEWRLKERLKEVKLKGKKS